MTDSNRRQFMAQAATITAIGAGITGPAWAEDYPSRPIHYVIGNPPGGTSDNIARMISPALSQKFGQPIVIENKPGGAGIISTDIVAKALPDGHTVGYLSNTYITVTPQLMKVPFDPFKDIEPIAFVGRNINVLAVHPSLKVSSVTELIAYAKAHPGELNYGSSGNASGAHLLGEYFCRKCGVEIAHIPYKGAGPAIVDLLAGRLSFVFDPAMLGSIRSGQLKALGVAEKVGRIGDFANIPFLGEEIPGWNSPDFSNLMFMPSKTPLAIREKAGRIFEEVLANPEIAQKLLANGYSVEKRSLPEAKERLKNEYAFMGSFLKESKIQI